MSPTPVYAPASFDGDAREVVASLPLSYAFSPEVENSVVVVDGQTGWVGATADAVRAGAAGVVVSRPGPADLGGLAELARSRPTIVVVDFGWASNPAVATAARLIEPHRGPARRLESRVVLPVGSDLDRALLEQLALVRQLVDRVVDLKVLAWSTHGYFATATAAGTTASLTSVLTGATPAMAQARLLVDDGGIDITLPASDTARPAEVRHTTPAGATLLPTRYETSQRATWRRLHALLEDGTTGNDLEDLEADIATLDRSRDRSATSARPHHDGP